MLLAPKLKCNELFFHIEIVSYIKQQFHLVLQHQTRQRLIYIGITASKLIFTNTIIMHYFAHFLFSKIVTPHSFLCPASAHPADTLWLFLIFLDLRFFKVQGIYFTGRFRDFWMTSGGFPHMAKAPQKEECPADIFAVVKPISSRGPHSQLNRLQRILFNDFIQGCTL